MQIVATCYQWQSGRNDNVRKIISKGKVGDVKWQAKMQTWGRTSKKEGYKGFCKAIVDQLWSGG